MRRREYLAAGAITEEGAPYALSVPYTRRAFVLWEGLPELVQDISLENSYYYKVPITQQMNHHVDFEQGWFDIVPKSKLKLSGYSFRGFESLDDYVQTDNEYKYLIDFDEMGNYCSLYVPKYKDEFKLDKEETHCLIGHMSIGIVTNGNVLFKERGFQFPDPERDLVRRGYVFKKMNNAIDNDM